MPNGDSTPPSTTPSSHSKPSPADSPPPSPPPQPDSQPKDTIPSPSPEEPEPYIPPYPRSTYKQFGIPFGLGILMLLLLGLGVFPGFGTTIVEVTVWLKLLVSSKLYRMEKPPVPKKNLETAWLTISTCLCQGVRRNLKMILLRQRSFLLHPTSNTYRPCQTYYRFIH